LAVLLRDTLARAFLWRRSFKVSVTATDLNPPMLEVARGKFGSEERVTFQPADATSLPFPDDSFDVLVCQFGVMFFPDKDQAYREVYRVLARGGRYVFNVWESHRYNPVGRVMTEIPARFFPRWAAYPGMRLQLFEAPAPFKEGHPSMRSEPVAR
jgi:ubiquinone/menaquinone biosynthesis C-methylase UbiE